MSNQKTSDTEKVRVINSVCEKLKERKLDKQISLVKRQKTLDLRYKKALTFNRDFKLEVSVRKSDRFGESVRTKEEKQVKEESDKDFIAAIEQADKTSEMAIATEPTDTINNGVEILKKALLKGCARFQLTALKVLGIELVELGDNDKEKYYIVNGINDLICAYE